MELPITGVFDVNWNGVSGVSGYRIDVSQNSNFFSKSFIDGSGTNTASFTGFKEGDSALAEIYSFHQIGNHKVYSETGISSSSKLFNVENFNLTSGQSFLFTGIKLDNVNLDSTLSSSGLLSTGQLNQRNLTLEYNIISPRSGDIITQHQDFQDEPFGNKITGYIYDDNGYHASFPEIHSNVISHNYTGSNKNFYLNLKASDIYTGSSTGIVKFQNKLPSVIDLSSNSTEVSNSGSLNIFPSYSRNITGVHAFLYSDANLSSITNSIATTNVSQFNFSIPLNSDRYIKVIPYANFGSGNHFVDGINYGLITNIDPIINKNKITTKNAVISSAQRVANIYCYSDLDSYSGFHLDISIYTGINSASTQYFSGSFNEDVNHSFDVTGSRSGQEENFNVDCILYESGNSTFLDSGSFSFNAIYPRIIKTAISETNISHSQRFNYTWDTTLNNPESYLTFLIKDPYSAQFTSDEKVYSVDMSGSRSRVLNVSLADRLNTGIVFDSVSLTGLSLAPNITGIINVNDRFFAPKFDQFLFAPALYTSYSNISGYKIFEKKSFNETGTSLIRLKDHVDSYPLNSTHLNQTVGNVDYINIPSPENSIPQSTNNFESGSFGTGYYNSGNIFNYKIVPFDFIGSGSAFNFDVEHGIANVTKVIREDTDATIVNVTTVTSEVSNVGTNLSGVSGDVNTVSVNLSGVSGTVNTVSTNLSTVSGTVDSVNLDLATISGRTQVLPTGQQVLSGNLNVTGDSHISGDLNVGRSEDNVLFSVHGTGSFINSNLNVSGRLAISGRMTLGGDPPTSSTNTGVFGQIAFDSQYFYVCTGTNKWGRVELSNW